MTLSLVRKVQVGFGLALGMLTVVILFSYRTTVAFRQSHDLVEHSHLVIEKLQLIFSAVQDVEAGPRGYAVAGDGHFLALYDSGAAATIREVNELRSLLADNPQQQRRIRPLMGLLAERVRYGKEVIQLRREKGMEASVRHILAGRGTQLTEAIRQQVEEMKDAERQLLAQSKLAPHRRANQALLLLTSGSLLGFVTLVLAAALIQRDITKRQQAEESLREQKSLLESILESIGDGVVAADPTGHFLIFNTSAKQILGTRPADGPPEEWSERFGVFQLDERTPYPWQDLPLVRATRGESVDGVELFLRPPGELTGRWLRCTARPLRDANGSRVGGVVAFQDITESKLAEEVLARKTAELARSNAELQQFAYVASHDLQEPLRMVASFTQLLAQRYRGRLDATADEFIVFAVDGAERMQRLIRDLLEYSRVGSAENELRKISGEIVLQQALVNLRGAVEESHAQITHDALPAIVGDEFQLTQLFQNLIGNAIKFRRQGPVRVHVGVAREGDNWVFSVRDNGIGVDPEFAERIFVMFKRLHGKGEYPGSGIGLAICRKIVERHGGRIWLESRAGEGATFCFTLPDRIEGREHSEQSEEKINAYAN